VVTGNTSSAVRAQRKSKAAALDMFPTPPWAVRALLHEVLLPRWRIWDDDARGMLNAWEPACGAGHCAIPLGEVFHRVYATDVADWGYGVARDLDFSFCGPDEAPWPIDWVITNPPFVLADTFARRAAQIARRGVALLMRLQWLEGGDRYRSFFSPAAALRPAEVWVFAERVPMIEGVWDPEASSATAYAWFLWDVKALTEPDWSIELCHFPPGMADLYTRPTDAALATPGEAKRRAVARRGEG
jgi:hypothetical protein